MTKPAGQILVLALAASYLGRAYRLKLDQEPMVAVVADDDSITVYSRIAGNGWKLYTSGRANRYSDWLPLERVTGQLQAQHVNRLFESAYPQYAQPAVTINVGKPPQTATDDARKMTQIRNIARGLDLLADVDENFAVDVVAGDDGGRRIVVISEEDEYSARRGSFDVIAAPSQADLRARLADLGWEPSPLGDGYFYTVC